MNPRLLPALLLAPALAGCSLYRQANPGPAAATADWRGLATQSDRQRLRGWRRSWDAALPRARAADPQAVAAAGALFNPDRALAEPMPPAGAYRCRTFKLGAAGAAMREFTAYGWFDCRVTEEGGARHFVKESGSQRPHGILLDATPTRAIFLGTLVLGNEKAPLRYGVDDTRDMVGYVERVDEARWRLVFPSPRFESMLDVVELVPA